MSRYPKAALPLKATQWQRNFWADLPDSQPMTPFLPEYGPRVYPCDLPIIPKQSEPRGFSAFGHAEDPEGEAPTSKESECPDDMSSETLIGSHCGPVCMASDPSQRGLAADGHFLPGQPRAYSEKIRATAYPESRWPWKGPHCGAPPPG